MGLSLVEVRDESAALSTLYRDCGLDLEQRKGAARVHSLAEVMRRVRGINSVMRITRLRG